MKAMIFAAGLGTRLRPITDNIPKAMLPLAGKTLLEHQIGMLKSNGITEIVINVHHHADLLQKYILENNCFGCHILFSDERDKLLNTGGGLLHTKDLLQTDEPFIALNVDILSNINLQALIAAHKNNDIATLVVSERATQRYLLFDDENILRGWTNISTGELRPQNLSAVSELNHLAFSGMQILSPKIFELMAEHISTDVFSMIDLYLAVCQTQNIRAFVPQDYRMMDVGKINQLQQAEDFAAALS